MITLDTLSGGDATKYPYYYELNVIEFLTVCSYYKSKREYEEQQRELARLQSGRNF